MFKRILVVVSLLLVSAMAQAQARPPRPPAVPPAPPAPPAAIAPDVDDFVDLEELHIDLSDLQAKIDRDLAPALALKIEPMLAGISARALDSLSLAGDLDDLDVWQASAAQRVRVARGGDLESIEYARGTSYLDQGRYQQALEAFDKAIAANGKRSDGAMYWKAYSLNRLGRGAEALSILDEMLKKYPSSRWANDAKALQVEVRQASGRPVNPAQENDEELKLIALNGLVSRDPERGLPLVEQILSGSASPRMKERALFVLAQSGSPRAKTLLTDVAKGKANPDLQMKALDYLGVFGGGPEVPLLVDVYKSSPDTEVKRRVIRSLAVAGRRGMMVLAPIPPLPPMPPMPRVEGLSKQDTARMEAEYERAMAEYERARVETDRSRATAERARADAERGLREAGSPGVAARADRSERDKARQAKAKEAGDALWQLYQGESSVELKREILRNMYFGDQSERLVQLARTEKDPELRQAAVQGLMVNRSPKSTEVLTALYREEKDPSVKRRIIDALGSRDSAGPLVQIARQETDPQLRKMLVQRLSMMKDKEATDYMMELLKK